MFGLLGEILPHPVEEIDAVGIIVAGCEFLVQTALFILPTGVEEQIHGPARQLVLGIVLAVLVAAPGVVEVRKIEAVDAFVLDQLEQLGQVVRIILGHGETHADLQPQITAQADTAERSFEGTLHSAERVMRFRNAIE